jgi:hypothetical protein
MCVMPDGASDARRKAPTNFTQNNEVITAVMDRSVRTREGSHAASMDGSTAVRDVTGVITLLVGSFSAKTAYTADPPSADSKKARSECATRWGPSA